MCAVVWLGVEKVGLFLHHHEDPNHEEIATFMLIMTLLLILSKSFSIAFTHQSSRRLQSNGFKCRTHSTAKSTSKLISINSLPSDTLYVLDGTAMMYRSYFGKESTTRYRNVKASGGEDSSYSTLAAFAATFARLLKDIRPKYIATAFDTGKTFRNDIFPSYKQNREKVIACRIFIS